jgi:ubiquitin-like 1-activating enzyme E1 A
MGLELEADWTNLKMSEEINFKLYDRQIRLWGVDAQKRMSKTRVLVYSINGLCAEICKNLVLSGVGNVHLMDDRKVTEVLLSTNFFVREQHIGQNVFFYFRFINF